MNNKIKYIVVHSGARDYYALAKSLFDNDKLKILITDFALNLKNSSIARFNLPLKFQFYKCFPICFFIVKFFKLNSDSVFSKKYLNHILKFSPENNYVIVFSYYAKHIIEKLKERNYRIVIFQIHPDPLYVKSRLLYAKNELSEFKNIDKHKVIDNELESLGQEFDLNYKFDKVDHIICASTETEKSLRYSNFSGDISILPYYSKFRRDNLDALLDNKISKYQKKQKNKILYIGTLSIRKGILHLVDLLLSDGFGECELHICTRHSLNLNLLDNFIDKSRIVLHFNKTDEEVKNLILDAQYVILPSFVEGFGLSLIESISLGTPILATENTSLVDLLKISKVGVCYKDYRGLANAISQNNLPNQSEYSEFLKNCIYLNDYMNEKKYSESLCSILQSFEKNRFYK